MSFDPGRLRRGEWMAGLGAVVLLVSLFALDWYTGGIGGWEAHTILRWFMLLTGLAGIALWALTATQPTDAVPLGAAVVTVVIAGLTTLLVAWRVLIDQPGANALVDVDLGAWIGLASAALVAVGAWLSMRDEDRDAPLPEIPVRRLA
jgi:hypothetical protein